MIRVILQNLLLFLLPLFAYVMIMVIRRRSQSLEDAGRIFERAPLAWLLGAGFLLMIAGLVYFGTSTGGRPGETYQPPVYVDGKVIPGQRK